MNKKYIALHFLWQAAARKLYIQKKEDNVLQNDICSEILQWIDDIIFLK